MPSLVSGGVLATAIQVFFFASATRGENDMQVVMRQHDSQDSEEVHWQYEKVQTDWVNVGPELSEALEAGFKSGSFYRSRSLQINSGRGCHVFCPTYFSQKFKMTCEKLEGMEIQFYDDNSYYKLRRKGPRVKVEGEKSAVNDYESVLQEDDRCGSIC
jgi:hypothetical protein